MRGPAAVVLVLVAAAPVASASAWTRIGDALRALLPRRAADEPCPLGPLVRGQAEPGAKDVVIPARKRAWEASLGGEEAARPFVRARLSGWPGRLLADRGTLPAADRDFVLRLARDTWAGLEAFTDREDHLPVDHVRLAADPREARVGDYTNVTTVGLRMLAIVAAERLGFIGADGAIARLRALLATLDGLESYRGFFYNYYDTTSRERTSNFVSFVDSAWLVAGLMVARSTFPALGEACTRLIARQDFRFFYDAHAGKMTHGYWVQRGAPSAYHYGMLYAESRLGSLIAIGKGDVPEEHWFRMVRTFPPRCAWQSATPQGRRRKTVRGHALTGGWYAWRGTRYVPSWGGSMFEALMPTLVLDEARWAPDSLGANDAAHVLVQRRWALEVLGYPVWGLSPSRIPGGGGYAEYGVKVLGALGYESGAVTPHAAALALAVAPGDAVADLRRLAERYDAYGEYGFYDAVDPIGGDVADVYLALDQAMTLVAAANWLVPHCIQERFAADPIAARVLPLLGAERFFD
ncbi:MAG TPA: glucoamylase family protein [Candidatus Binatia bacterium]|nr:glucoamylase family protein [Candidatus Binatia bacterium]